MKNCFKILAAGIALVLCLFAITSCGKGIKLDDVTADPLGAVENAYEEYMSAIDDKYGKFFDAFDEAKSGVSSHKLTFSMPDVMNVEINADVDPEDRYAAGLKLSVSEIDANLKLWSDGEKLAFSLPELLGEGSYGVNLSTFKDDVKESPLFSEDFTYEDFKQMLFDSLGISDDMLNGVNNKGVDGEKLDKYFDDVKKTIEDITPTVVEESVGDVNCISVEYNIPKDTIKDVWGGLVDALKATFPDAEVTDTSDYDAVEDVTVKFYIAKKIGAIYKSVLVSGENKITVDYSADLANPLNITFSVNADGEKVTAALKEEATLDNVDISFDVKSTGGEAERTGGASFAFDVKNKNMDFKVIADGRAVFNATGSLEANEGKFEISLDKILVNGDDVDLKLSYSIVTGIELDVEEVPAYKDITDMDEDDLSNLAEKIVKSEIGSKLYEEAKPVTFVTADIAG